MCFVYGPAARERDYIERTAGLPVLLIVGLGRLSEGSPRSAPHLLLLLDPLVLQQQRFGPSRGLAGLAVVCSSNARGLF